MDKTVCALKSECWEWEGPRTRKGYGRWNLRGGQEFAHRMAWRLAGGEIPPGLCVLHRCDNAGCVNPDHLFLGTKGDNNRDRASKGRSSSAPRRSILTPDQVQEIRRRATGRIGEQASFGREYGVSAAAINDILRGRRWKRL